LQVVLYLVVLLALAKPLGDWMARVYQGQPCGLERKLHRLCGVRPEVEMGWKEYARALLAFNLVGLLAVYAIQRLQGVLPLNPERLGAVSPDSSFNTAVSFATNTNWQGYAGETTLSCFTQMAALCVQNFVSAASGMAVLAAVIRGFARKNSEVIGNFWVDLVRGTLYVLLPLSLLLAVALVSQGVVQTFHPYAHTQAEQTIALGPAASQVAIKQLGTNGGGFFNANSAHPLENPTPLANFLELLAILLLPAALCHTFGRMVRDRRQGVALLAAMVILFVPALAVTLRAEQSGNPLFARAGVDVAASSNRAGTWRARRSASASPTRRSGRPRRRRRRTARSTRCTTRSRRWAGWCRWS
jgi:K+-transporting ATPase ATPase A chain